MRTVAIVAAMVVCVPLAGAQGIASDLLGGKLINPERGQWAWYDLQPAEGFVKYVVRQAVIGEEKVGRKTGYWVEIEVVPSVGYKTIYKMLLTGPASDPGNIHRIIVKQGRDPAFEAPLDDAKADEDKPKQKRKSKGMETLDVPQGKIKAERLDITEGDRTITLWVNEDIKPSGIVQMRTEDGQMTLRSFGKGGEYGVSAITEKPLKEPPAREKPEVRVE